VTGWEWLDHCKIKEQVVEYLHRHQEQEKYPKVEPETGCDKGSIQESRHQKDESNAEYIREDRIDSKLIVPIIDWLSHEIWEVFDDKKYNYIYNKNRYKQPEHYLL